MTEMNTLRLARKRELAQAYRLFAALRWGDTGDGHISARDPEQSDSFWLLPAHIPFRFATMNNLVLVNAAGDAKSSINISAYYIHHPVHKARPDIICAAHTHTPWGTPFAAEVRPILPIVQEACVFYNDCAMFDDEEVQIQDLAGGQRIASALGDNGAIILRNHGLLTAADSVAEATGRFVMLERVAEAHMKARNAKPVSQESALRAQQDLVAHGAGRNAFEALVRHHLADVDVTG